MATSFLQVANRATTTLASTITADATSLSVASGAGALFPSSGTFHITIDSEILACTSRSSDTLTVTRAQESTSAAEHLAAATVTLNVTAKALSDIHTAVNALEDVLPTSLTNGGVLLGSGTGAITAMSVLADGEMIVGDGTTDPVAESGATLRTSIGVGTTDSPQFAGATLSSSSANEPILNITNTHADATAGYIKFIKDPASGEGADNDTIGTITFYGTNAANTTEEYGRMEAYVIEADNGTEAGGIKFSVAENDATMTAGLQILGVKDADGEVDVTIAAGAASTTTVSGGLAVTGATVLNGAVTLGSDATDVITINGTVAGANAVIFEGDAGDGNEVTLSFVDPDADRTIYMPNQGGYLGVFAADTSSTQISATPGELNVLDGLARGSIIYGNASAATAALSVGSANTVLKSDGTDIAWGSITVLGTIATGTWEATDIAIAHGGTGASSAGDARTNLGLGTAATASTGISNTNVPVFTTGVANDDFLRVAGTSIEGRSASEVLSDIGAQASLTFGISNTNAVKIDAADVADDEYARFTANGLESRSTSEVLSDIGGQASLTFGISNTNAVKIDAADVADDEYARFTANGLESRTAAEVAADIEGSIDAVGALNSGSISTGFGNIDIGSCTFDTTGAVSTGNLSPAGDVAIADGKVIKLGGTRPADDEPATGGASGNNTGYGIVVLFDAGAAVAIGDAVSIGTDGRVIKPVADATGTLSGPCIGVATTAAGSADDDVYVMTHGVCRHDDWNFGTKGQAVYIEEADPGDLSLTAPNDDGDYAQRVGVAITDDVLLVMPSIDVIEHTGA